MLGNIALLVTGVDGSLVYPDPYKKGLGNKARSSVHIGMC